MTTLFRLTVIILALALLSPDCAAGGRAKIGAARSAVESNTAKGGAATASPRTVNSTPRETKDGISGWYYFKGMQLLQLRMEGREVVRELVGEKTSYPYLVLQSGKMKSRSPEDMVYTLLMKRHIDRGRLLDRRRIEFADTNTTLADLYKFAQVQKEDLRPEEQKEMKGFPPNGFGRYFERWEILEGGRIAVVSSVPVLSMFGSHFTREVQEMQSDARSISTAFRNPSEKINCFSEYRRVCAWKITDAREIRAWQDFTTGDFTRAASLFHGAAKAAPKRPFPCLGEAWALMGAGDFEQARQAFARGRARITDETRPFLLQFVLFLKDQIYSYETQAKGPETDFQAFFKTIRGQLPPDLRNHVLPISKKTTSEFQEQDFQAIERLLADFPAQENMSKTLQMRGRGRLMPIGQNLFLYRAPTERDFTDKLNLVGLQVCRGHQWRARGLYPQAIYQYAIAAHMGQMLRHGDVGDHDTGCVAEQVGLRGFFQLFEEGLLASPETVQYLSKIIAALEREEPRQEPFEGLSGNLPLLTVSNQPVLDVSARSMPLSWRDSAFEDFARHLKAKIALLRAGCFLKSKSLKPPWPDTLPAEALPRDPFAPDQAIRYLPSGSTAIFYSVGPDKKDEKATVSFEPMKENDNRGDIILRVR